MILVAMRKLVIIWMLFLALPLGATHLVGGEIFYDYLGNNQYRITLLVYRDCGPTNTNNTQFDPQAMIGIFNNGAQEQMLQVQAAQVTNIPVTATDPCLVAPPSACIEEARYTAVVSLPPKAGGYDIVYQRCCRNPSTQNILNPNDEGSTYHAHIPFIEPVNNSPRFTNYPPTVLCSNNPFDFDHSATDADGDSLVYSLCTPWDGGSATNPAPTPTAPPFNAVQWAPGFSVNNQINGTPTLSIDPNTGQLTGTPATNGIYTFGVCVQEFRNGQLLSESRRDFQFWVTNCDPVLIAGVPTQTDSCGGLSVQFGNSSVGASFYEWHFGDGTTSTATNPSHTFPAPGTYSITLIANPGWNCADTSITYYTVNEPLSISFDSLEGQCITTNSFDFESTGNYGAGALIEWDFGGNSMPMSGTGSSVSNVVFLDSGYYAVKVDVEENGCFATYQDSVLIFPEPEIDFIYPAQVGCQEYFVSFTDASYSWTPLSYFWDFGNGETSTEQNPSTSYPDVGFYDVSLTITADSGCATTQTISFPNLIEVLPSPTANFGITPDETDVFDPHFEIFDFTSGDIVATYYVTGAGDTLPEPNGHVYTVDDTGYIDVIQWVYNSQGCPDTMINTIYLKPVTTVYAPNSFTPNGDGMNDVWLPQVRDVYDYELIILTRWGEVIFQTDDQYAGWDGTFKGIQSPSDVYVYKLRYGRMDRIMEEKIGHITLVR